MQRIDVALNERAYPVWIGSGLLAARDHWTPFLPDAPVVVVSNDVVAPLYLAQLQTTLAAAELHSLVLPDGEVHKTFDNWRRTLDFLVDIGAGRDACLVALGGGVIGDLCGFAAASYMRGVRFIQAPTTLLAQVDASVGGKTGINHPAGKNLVGAFHQPAAVIADTATLSTLPEREYRAGLAEVVKYGAIRDMAFLEWLERQAEALSQREPDAITRCVIESVRHKAAVVAEDEREAGARALLNFGHSFGHALETLTHYETFLHGEAVAIGMVTAARLSEQRGLCEPGAADRLATLLASLGLPVHMPESIETSQMLTCMQRDKKNEARRQRLVVLDAIGRARVDADSSKQDIARAIDACRTT